MSDLKKVISIDLSDNTKQGFEGIEQTFKDVDNSIKKAESTSGNLRLELKQLQKDLLSGKFTGEEFTKATQRAGELKDSIGDLNSRIKTLASDSRNLDTLVSAAGAMASGFAIAEGAAGLLGDENKDLQQSILKVQSSMAILQGVTALTNELQKDSTLIVGLQTLAQKAYNLVLDESTGKLNYFKLALAGTGIGIFIILLGELVANWDSVSNAISGTTNEMKLLNSVSEDVSSNLEDVYNDLYTVKSAFDQARDGAISKKDALKVYNDTLGDTLGKAKTLEEAEKLYADKTQDYIKASMLRAQAQALIAKAATESAKVATGEAADIGFLDRLGNIWEGYTTGVYKSLDDVSKAKVNAANKDIDTLLNLATKAQTEADNLSKKSKLDFTPDEPKKETKVKDDSKKILDAEKKLAEEREVINKQYRDKQIEEGYKAQDDVEAARKANAERFLTDQEVAIQRENEAYKIKYDNAVKAGYDTEELEIEHLNNINDINLTAQEKAYAQQKEAADKEIEDTQAVADQKTAIQEAQLNLAAKAAGFLNAIAGKNKAIQRAGIIAENAVGIAKMIISNNQANIAALATPQAVATSGAAAAPVIALNNISTALGIATTVAATAKALSAVGGGGGAGGASSTTGASPAAPQAQFNIVGQSSNNQLAQTIAGAQQQPVQAFVVAGEVSTQQALDRNKIQNSTFL